MKRISTKLKNELNEKGYALRKMYKYGDGAYFTVYRILNNNKVIYYNCLFNKLNNKIDFRFEIARDIETKYLNIEIEFNQLKHEYPSRTL